MGFGGALFAVSAAQAVGQISSGYAANAEAKANASMVEDTGRYNAAMFGEKVKLLDIQNNIEQGRYVRLKGQYASKSAASLAASGLDISGSSMAVMINAQTQIEIDQAIAEFNNKTEKNMTNAQAAEATRSAGAQADALRRQGKAAVKSGYSNAFSSLLKGAANYGMYKLPQSTTFDYSSKTPAQAFGGSDGRYVTRG